MKVGRGDLRDVYVEHGRSVVMVGETVIVLSELATAILEAVPDHEVIGIHQLTAAVVAVFGEPDPPDTAADLTLANVHELVAHGVLIEERTGGHSSATAPTRAAVAALRSALRHIRSDDATQWRLPALVTADEFLAAAHQHQVVPYVERHRDRVALPTGSAASLHSSAAARAAAADILATELSSALDTLDRAGVRALTVKGLALAAQAYGDMAGRGAGDLDLLVAPSDVERAHAALIETSWRPDPLFPQPGPSWAWRHMQRTGHEVTLHGGRSTIDLHWYLSPSHSTFPPFEQLWERRSLVRVGDRDVPTLGLYDALAHSAGHAAKDRWSWLRSLVDVHLLASNRDAWRTANRPLRADQLLTIGLAARMLGEPAGAPGIVRDAMNLTDAVWDDVLERQFSTASGRRPSHTPGVELLRSMRTLRRTSAGPIDTARQLGFSLLPPWLTATEPSTYAAVAVPRVIAKRARDVSARLRA